jgi:crotonobetainyl-CoA:carnitine CoA-transferase CaiB-like acyl-CoA transferase
MTVPDILAHPHIAHRGLLSQFENVPAAEGPVSVMRTGFQSDGQPVSVDTPPPVLGAHNDELLKELGYDETAIAQLSQEGVI